MQLYQRDATPDKLAFQYNDGGRSKYFKAENVGDCSTRAIAIASGRDYKEVYNLLRRLSRTSPRNGVDRKWVDKAARLLGGKWRACMTIGSGCQVHLRPNEVPMDKRIVCSCSGHNVAVINGVIHDTYDPSRDGTRCVYGYWTFN